MDNNISPSLAGNNAIFVAGQTGQGVDIQATIVRLTRHLAVFEVYSLQTVLHISQVLSDFKIVINDRTVYSGKAVVSSLVNAGAITVCEVTLDEAWLDVDLFALGRPGEKLRAEFEHFIQQWQQTYKILPEYKLVIVDMQTFFLGLRSWLDQVEMGIRSMPAADRFETEREAILALMQSSTPALSSFFERFEVVARQIEPELQPAHRAFCRRLLHPFLLSSPFMHRIFAKPLGYAGDYEMVNMILRDPFEGSSLFAKLLNVYILRQAPAEAHRNRVAYLTEKLIHETNRVAQCGQFARILSLGCGPAKEVQNFLAQHDLCERAQFTLLDSDDETLRHVSGVLETIKRNHRRTTSIKLVKKSVQQLLKRAGKPKQDGVEYDFIYCAGLFDYLTDRVCKSLLELCYDLLAPGGLLVATNVDPTNPIRNIMDYMFEWHLIYRNGQQFSSLMPEQASLDHCSLKAELTGSNIFLEVRKPSPHS